MSQSDAGGTGNSDGVMDFLDAVLGPLNLIDRAEGLFSALRYGDYRSARTKGSFGVAVEVARSAVGANTTRFALVRSDKHCLSEVESLLRRYGIPIFGRTHDERNMYFSVKKRQAGWAEYILLQAGVELANPVFDRRNPGYVGRHGPGWMPTPWAEGNGSAPVPGPAAVAPTTGGGTRTGWGRWQRWLDDLLAD